MSEGFIADSSVGVAWAVHAQASEATNELLDSLAAGAPLVVPTLWPFEIANSLLVLFRRKKILAEERNRALAALVRLPLVVDDEGPRLAFGRMSELAAEHGLSVYDAAYLELALRRKFPLASRDEALCKAAQDCRVKLLLWPLGTTSPACSLLPAHLPACYPLISDLISVLSPLSSVLAFPSAVGTGHLSFIRPTTSSSADSLHSQTMRRSFANSGSFAMKPPKCRQVLDCRRPLPLFR